MLEVQDSILHPYLLPIRKLEEVLGVLHLRSYLVQYQPLQDLHHIGGEGHRPVVLGLDRTTLLRNRDNTGRLPQCRDFSQVQLRL